MRPTLRVDCNFKNLDDAKLMTSLLVDEINRRCGCSACRAAEHASYCAVHNAPALPTGKCNCGAQR